MAEHPTGLLAEETLEEITAREKAAVAGDLSRHCRLLADNLARAIEMAEARQDTAPLPAMRIRLEALLDYEQALAKRAGSPTADRRYDPGLKTRRLGAA